jgi:hypothetical protein
VGEFVQPSAQLVALTDQQHAAVQEVAKVLAAYHRSLVAEGLHPEMASELVHAYAETYWEAVWHRCCPCQMVAPPDA